MSAFQDTGGRPVGGNGPGVYSLKWNSFQSHVTKGLSKLLEQNSYTDVTLACEGSFLKAHKLLLSLCSPFFKRLFEVNDADKTDKNTIVILNNVRFKDLENIIRFIYNGHTNVNQADLNNFLETGELLQIEGLASCSTNQGRNQQQMQNDGSGAMTGNPTTATASQLPPPPALQSFANRNLGLASNSSISAPIMESRLRATLTSSNSPNHSQGQIPMTSASTHSSVLQQQQQQSLGVKRPRLAQDLPSPIQSQSTSSKLQSILTGQSYSNPPMLSSKPIQLQQSNSPQQQRSPPILIERDPLEQDDDVIHIDHEADEATDHIECEPLIEMGTVSNPIHVFESGGGVGENGTEEDEEEGDYENSLGQVLAMGQDSEEDLYNHPSTSQHKDEKPTVSNASGVLTKKKRGGKKPARQKYRTCVHCGGLFYRSNLSRHMSQVHTQILLAQGKRLFRCGVCRTLYRSTGHLQAHIQKQHGHQIMDD